MSNELKNRVNLGMSVKTLDGKLIGRVTTLHGDTFEVEKGVFFNHDHAVAFDEIARVDGQDVVLSLSTAALDEMRAKGGVGTALADRAAGVVDHAREAIDEAVHAGHGSKPKPT
jgi:hypothetical protein